MRSRVFNIMQYEKHPYTKEVLLTEEQIIDGLDHRSIKEWAYIAHTEDTYSLKDEQDDTAFGKRAGDKKPKHWHIVLNCPNKVELSAIAKWFGIAENFIEIPKGHGAFLDCVEYLTHEETKQQELGKFEYSDEEVKANFEWREKLNEREEQWKKYGRRHLSEKDKLRYDVRYDGLSLRNAVKKDRILAMNDSRYLMTCRLEYLAEKEPPKTRVNYYLDGKASVGKGCIARAIARNLYPDLEDDEEIFFNVGGDGVAYDGYDGQPVIIWNDRRAVQLIREIGRGNLFNIFDTHPTKFNCNIKYGKINLTNTVNIINGMEPYKQFLDGLAGTYTDKFGNEFQSEDKNQSYRRFPFIINVRPNDFDLLINRGFIDSDASFQEYEEHKNMVANMRRINEICANNENLCRELEGQAVTPIIEEHKKTVHQLESGSDLSEDEIREMFKNVGKQDVEKTRRQEIEKLENEKQEKDEEIVDELWKIEKTEEEAIRENEEKIREHQEKLFDEGEDIKECLKSGYIKSHIKGGV